MFGSHFMAFLWSLWVCWFLAVCSSLKVIEKPPEKSVLWRQAHSLWSSALGDLTAESPMTVSLVLWAQTRPFLHCRLLIHLHRGNVSGCQDPGRRESIEHLGQVPRHSVCEFSFILLFSVQQPCPQLSACLPDPGPFVLASEGKPPASVGKSHLSPDCRFRQF